MSPVTENVIQIKINQLHRAGLSNRQ